MKMANRINLNISGPNLFKNHFQDDYMFGMRQLKCLKFSQIILKYVNILPAKFDFEKVKQNKVREVWVQKPL